jgi:protein tyrosine phosphatase
MDVPSDSHTLLHLIHEVNEQTKPEQYPIVVHCTAGVGRTGTYIAIDAMIDKIEQEGKIDIYNFVLQMRRERNLMVQTVVCYLILY